MNIAARVTVLLSLVLSISSDDAADGPRVKTKQGTVQGFTRSIFDTHVNVFLGIPFAEPPVGKLRFKRPQPAEAWKGTLDATKFAAKCPQPESAGQTGFENDIYSFAGTSVISEDCLYLNIWAPEDAKKLPVVIWIHGGGFNSGTASSSVYDGRYMSASEDVIFVSIQYRVGMLGFLYLGNDDAPGNMGLIDQHLAIKWVHDNIKAFGGDKKRITIAGGSAGAACVSLHIASDLPRYFQQAILQSAPQINFFSYRPEDETLKFSEDLIKQLECEQDTIGCLRRLSHRRISEVVGIMPGYTSTIDNYFLKMAPQESFKSVKDLKILIGTNENEGYSIVMFLIPGLMEALHSAPDDISKYTYEEFMRNVPKIEGRRLKMLDMFYEEHTFDSNLQKLDVLIGDMWSSCPALELSDKLTPKNDLFMYRLHHRSSACMWPEWTGVAHGCELDLVLGIPLNSSLGMYAMTDRILSSRMLLMWGNFLKTGNPNMDEDNHKVIDKWPPYINPMRNYVIIDMPNIRVGKKFKHNECQYWREYGPGAAPKEEPASAGIFGILEDLPIQEHFEL